MDPGVACFLEVEKRERKEDAQPRGNTREAEDTTCNRGKERETEHLTELERYMDTHNEKKK